MKKNKIIMSLILSALLTTNSLNAIPHFHIANSMAAAHASRKRNQIITVEEEVTPKKYPVYQGKIVDKFDMKFEGKDYLFVLLDKDGNESTIEKMIQVMKYSNDSIIDQLKIGSVVKYIDSSFGEDPALYFDNILEIDGVKPNRNIKNYIIHEGKIIKQMEVKTTKCDTVNFFIDRDGDESTTEDFIKVRKNELKNYSIFDLLKEGTQLKYKDTSLGAGCERSLNNILEIDGVKTR